MKIQFWKNLDFQEITPTEELTRIFSDSNDLDSRLKALGWRHFGNLGEQASGSFYSHYQAPETCEFKAVIYDHSEDRAVFINTWVDTRDFFNRFAPALMSEESSRVLPTIGEYMSPDRLN